MKSLVHLFMTSILMLTQVSFAQRDKGEILVITPRNDTVIASGLVKINNAGNIVFREKKGGKKRTIDVQYVQRIEIAEGKNKGNYQKVETLENGTVLMKETVSGPIALFEEKIFENKTYYRSMPDGFGGSWNYTTGTSEVIQTNFYIYKND